MHIIEILLIALSVSADAFAVAVAMGLKEKKLTVEKSLTLATLFGGFQGVMVAGGFFLASIFASQIRSVDHWIAFFLLGYIGIKMIRESTHDAEIGSGKDLFGLSRLVTLAFATSIDALAVGISLASFRGIDIISTSAIIALITGSLSYIGVQGGKRLGIRFGSYAEKAGGTILILIALKILIEHLFF